MDENDLQIFVSHSHEDNAFSLRLVADLRERLGEDAIWFDTSGGLHGGEAWWDKIVGEITARSCFLVVLSPSSWNSRWVSQEMGIAYRQQVELGKRLLPVRLADLPRRADWAGIQEINFQPPRSYADALAELLAILNISETTTAPTIAPPPTSKASAIQQRLAEETHTAYGRERWSDVMDKTDALIASQAMTTTLWIERASSALAMQNGSLALTAMDEVLKLTPHDIPLLRMRAQAQMLLHRYREAAATLALAQTIAPLDDFDVRLPLLQELCETLRKAGDWTEFFRRLNDMQDLVEALPAEYNLAPQLSLLELQVSLLEQREIQGVSHVQGDLLRRIDYALTLAPKDNAWHVRKVELLTQMRKNEDAVVAAQEALTRCSVTEVSDLAAYAHLAFIAKDLDAKRRVLREAEVRGLDDISRDKLRLDNLFVGVRRELEIAFPKNTYHMPDSVTKYQTWLDDNKNVTNIQEPVFSPAGDLLASVTLEPASQAPQGASNSTDAHKTFWVQIWATDTGQQLMAFDTNTPPYPRGTITGSYGDRQISDVVLQWLQNGKLLAITQNWVPNPIDNRLSFESSASSYGTRTALPSDSGWQSRTILINAHTARIEWVSSWVEGHRDVGWASISPDGSRIAWINHPRAIAAESVALQKTSSSDTSRPWGAPPHMELDTTPSTITIYELRTGRQIVSISNNQLLSLSNQQKNTRPELAKIQGLMGILRQAKAEAKSALGSTLRFCSPISWSPDGRAIAVGVSFIDMSDEYLLSFAISRTELFGALCVINAQTGQISLVSEKALYTSAEWSIDGSKLAISEVIRNNSDSMFTKFHGYTVLKLTADGAKIKSFPHTIWPCLWSPHGKRLLEMQGNRLNLWNTAQSTSAKQWGGDAAGNEKPYISWDAFANQDQPYTAAWYGSDDSVITFSADGTLRVWDVV